MSGQCLHQTGVSEVLRVDKDNYISLCYLQLQDIELCILEFRHTYDSPSFTISSLAFLDAVVGSGVLGVDGGRGGMGTPF